MWWLVSLALAQQPAVDTDGDGLDDAREAGFGTDPAATDTDRDGLPDGAEVDRDGTDPMRRDSDGDSLGDGEEVEDLDTDPRSRDSDGDTLRDDEELDGRSDPTRADSDDDGLFDDEEIAAFTDPMAVDSDGDGLDDELEFIYLRTDPTFGDTDADGVSDIDELDGGTNPLVADIGLVTQEQLDQQLQDVQVELEEMREETVEEIIQPRSFYGSPLPAPGLLSPEDDPRTADDVGDVDARNLGDYPEDVDRVPDTLFEDVTTEEIGRDSDPDDDIFAD